MNPISATMKTGTQNAVPVESGRPGNAEPSLRDKYLTKQQVAELLHVSPRSIDNYMRRGLLVFLKLGRTVRFRLEDIEKQLAENCRVCNLRSAK